LSISLGLKGLDPMTTVKSPTLYIDGKPYFLEGRDIATKIPPLGSRQGEGEAPPHQQQVQGIRGGKGPPDACKIHS
jgi:hypothetical protein